jgi:hypothetical protein
MTSKAFGLAQLGNAYSDGALSSRNKIINGSMTIDQRNAGAAVSNQLLVDTHVDRWYPAGTLWRPSASASSDAPAGFSSSFKYL